MSETMGAEQLVKLHGWDPRPARGMGPPSSRSRSAAAGAFLSQLRELPGSWYGKLRTEAPEEPPLSFHVAIHDLGDAGLALLDIQGSPGGPLEVVLVIPAQRRARIRPDMAFEFVAFLGFLRGLESPGSEMAIYDYIQRVRGEADEQCTLVFSSRPGS